MEMTPANQANMLERVKDKVMETMKKAKKIGEDDPRKIFHSIKVGLALTLVSLFYYSRPLYDGYGQAGMWAILTVVVVFEFTVGGTISKGLNRGGATLLAGALGVGAEYLASLCGEKGEPIVLGFFVFILAAVSTFTRFFPNVKRRYDYGVLIFILTFSLVAVSGFRVTQIMQMAHQRVSTILIGGATCIVISMSLCPVWAGQDLHYLVAGNIEKLATFFQGFGGEFCTSQVDEILTISTKDDKDKPYVQIHKTVLNSKATEESLANFAWWETGHGRFKFHHPWKLYLNIGVLTRECACQIETLNACISSKPSQVASEVLNDIQPRCKKMSIECSNALKELASAIKNTTSIPLSAAEIHIRNSNIEADHLRNILENSSLPTKAHLQEIMPLLVIASVLLDIIKLVEKIWIHVNQLSQKAGFDQNPNSIPTRSGIVKPVDDGHVVIEIVQKLEINK